MMNGKGKLGKAGEEEVCKWLISKGHTILERNWRAGKQEIDIISLDRDGIHFVEVKSRTAPVQGEPEEAPGSQTSGLEEGSGGRGLGGGWVRGEVSRSPLVAGGPTGLGPSGVPKEGGGGAP